MTPKEMLCLTECRQRAGEHIEALADKTNGRSYFITKNNFNQDLSDALIGSQTYASNLPADQISAVVSYIKLVFDIKA